MQAPLDAVKNGESVIRAAREHGVPMGRRQWLVTKRMDGSEG